MSPADDWCVFWGTTTGVAWFEVDMPDVLRAKHKALAAAGASFSSDSSGGRPLVARLASATEPAAHACAVQHGRSDPCARCRRASSRGFWASALVPAHACMCAQPVGCLTHQ